MRKIITLMGSLLTLLVSCTHPRNMTIEEFKQKFDWDITIATNTGRLHTGRGFGTIYTFSYLNKTYEIRSSFPCNDRGAKYYILVDRNAPGRSYIILFHKPVKPDRTPDYFLTGKIQRVSRWDQNFLIVRYQYYCDYNNRWFRQCTIWQIFLFSKRSCQSFKRLQNIFSQRERIISLSFVSLHLGNRVK